MYRPTDNVTEITPSRQLAIYGFNMFTCFEISDSKSPDVEGHSLPTTPGYASTPDLSSMDRSKQHLLPDIAIMK